MGFTHKNFHQVNLFLESFVNEILNNISYLNNNYHTYIIELEIIFLAFLIYVPLFN